MSLKKLKNRRRTLLNSIKSYKTLYYTLSLVYVVVTVWSLIKYGSLFEYAPIPMLWELTSISEVYLWFSIDNLVLLAVVSVLYAFVALIHILVWFALNVVPFLFVLMWVQMMKEEEAYSQLVK